MNDSKYVRLHPERAVKPLYDLVEGLLLKIVGSQYATTIQVELSDLRAALNAHEDGCFPVDEPLFLLRGQDVLAPEIVRAYAGKVLEGYAFAPNTLEAGGHIMDFADRMEAWEPRKLPD